jgi:hypothetical protein
MVTSYTNDGERVARILAPALQKVFSGFRRRAQSGGQRSRSRTSFLPGRCRRSSWGRRQQHKDIAVILDLAWAGNRAELSKSFDEETRSERRCRCYSDCNRQSSSFSRLSVNLKVNGL